LRNLDVSAEQLRAQPVEFVLGEPVERQLALKLMQFDQALADVLVEYKPNLLCNYLFDLAQLFARFFDQCSVRDAGSDDLQRSRLQLCDLTARSLSKGLELLGIDTLERI
jgi:arginyl-tRNA synthetase